MKQFYIIILIILSSILYCQNQYYYSNDSLICVPKQIKTNTKLNIFSNYKVLGIISGITATSIPLFLLTNKDDKLGQYAFGSVSFISVSTGIIALTSYFNSKDNKTSFYHYTCMFLAGTMDGFNEELTFHYSLVKDKMPYLNDQWFDPSKSWTNKYNNNNINNGPAYPGSTSVLVGFTDGYHFTRMTNKLLIIGGIITFDKPKKLNKSIKKLIFTCFSYSIGKGITHYLIKI